VAERPEITAELNRNNRCIVITVVGASKTATFRISGAASLWSDGSPCPVWALDAVRDWASTPAAAGLFGQLANTPGSDETTVVERRLAKPFEPETA